MKEICVQSLTDRCCQGMRTYMAKDQAASPLPKGARGRLIGAAAKLFQEKGYAATGLSEILDAASAPKGSLYHHFPGGKAELGAAAM